jgi:hypothetical protein
MLLPLARSSLLHDEQSIQRTFRFPSGAAPEQERHQVGPEVMLIQLQPFMAVFPQECMGQLASWPT